MKTETEAKYPHLEIVQDGSAEKCLVAVLRAHYVQVIVDCRENFGDPSPLANLITAAPELLEALRAQINWKMRDGTPCDCPAGRDEDEPKGKMPTMHSTSCEMLRAAILKAEGK